MPYTEFYCDNSTGANINAGDDKAVVTSTNGDWGNAAANRFTAAAGTPFSGVSVGDFASVYLDGATVAVYIARVTAVNGGGASLDLSTTAKSGTAPSTGATGRSCTVGGKWKGPNAGSGFPLSLAETTMTNASGDPLRINMKNTSTYSVTTGVSQANNGPMVIQGYSSSVGDGGKFTLDGGTSNITILTVNGVGVEIVDFIVSNNLTSGTANGINVVSGGCHLRRGVVTGTGGPGINGGGNITEVEVYDVNKSNNGGSRAGIVCTLPLSVLRRVIVHDVSGSNGIGIFVTANTIIANSIVDTCGSDAVVGNLSNNQSLIISALDTYNNGGDGLDLTLTTGLRTRVYVENSNFIKNGGYGVRGSTTAIVGLIQTCGFGAGTQANTSGTTTSLTGITEADSVTYDADVTPWTDPANGDFRVSLAAAKGAGRGAFTQTAGSYAGTIAYPDIGAAQHQDAGGGGGAVIGGGAMIGGF